MQVRLVAAQQLRRLVSASEQYQRLALLKRGTFKLEVPPAGAPAPQRLPAGDPALLDQASGAVLNVASLFCCRLAACMCYERQASTSTQFFSSSTTMFLFHVHRAVLPPSGCI